MFRCKNSKVCIHIEDVCNNLEDCPLGDDENVCILSKSKCPDQCFCYNLTIQRTNMFFNQDLFFFKNIYVSLWVSGTNITSLKFVKLFTEAKYLYLDHNRIQNICGVLPNHKMVIIFHSNDNEVPDLLQFCICNVITIKDINLSKNKISHVHKQAFWKLSRLQVLDLANNFLNNLEGSFLANLTLLKLTQNPFQSLQHNAFRNADINTIETDDYHICCIVLCSVSCDAFKPWYVSCSKLLPTISMRIFWAFVSIIVVLFNVLSIYLQSLSSSQSSFKMVIVSVNLTDILCFCYLTVLLIADSVYGEKFITKEFSWRSSIPCLVTFICALIFSILSAFYLSFISLCRTMFVTFPLNLTLKNSTLVVRILCILLIMTIVFALCVSLLYRMKYSTFSTSLCLPFIDPTNSVKLIKLLTISVTSLHIFSSIFICINYVILLKKLKISVISRKSIK